MERSPRRTAVRAGIGALIAVTFATGAFAGDYHNGGGLVCSDCHIIHASKDGTLYNGGNGNPGLLKVASGNDLCLSCHDGTDTTAPDEVATGTAAAPNDTLGTAYASVYKNAAGFFQSNLTTTATNYGHDLGGGAVTAIQGTWVSDTTGMKCTDCHDAHGNANYRNLKTRPGTAPATNPRYSVTATEAPGTP